ncbi:MAG: hydantoinase/oxoprolinase family protein, partial [Acidobacteria bacterium]|nr:hydantoinase/oxoprolinase family protein [Acidobacteriota bacterium]
TQFVNAVVERDARRLSKVAVLRLCGPFSKHMPPCVDWPPDLRELVLGYHARVKGGLEVDGGLISDLDEEEIREQCASIRSKGIRSIVVNGVFSPIDTTERQEERAAAVIRNELPGCHVVCAKDVANLGFVERENAAILNASILPFARRTIRSFQEPIKALGLTCPVFITQNDGTILSGDMASKLPIRTFSSGPTNSMRGAAYLVQGQVAEEVIVVDIGGTTTDAGLLLKSGFPRQQAAYSELAGVRMNFSCPDIKSIGLGGGSIVRKGDSMSVGPDSVGYRLATEGLVFKGSTLTATDCAVASNPRLDIGDRSLAEGTLGPEEAGQFETAVRRKLETVIDKMKTSPEDLPVILVGGGAVIAPDQLAGASRVVKPRWSEVANAVGTAIARVSAVVDTVRSTESRSSQQVVEELKVEAIQKAIQAGAEPSSVGISEVDVLPLSVSAHPLQARGVMGLR